MQNNRSPESEKLNFEIQYIQFNKEQEKIRSYVLTKPLQRPKTNFFSIAIILFIYCLFCGVLSFFILRLFLSFLWLKVLLITFVWIVTFWLMARRLFIKIIECYQHYAKESTRRKCLCMPTCSEYAIEVLRKDFLPIALSKIRKRLFVTCKNGFYKIDLP